MHDEISFLDHQFLAANPFHQLAHVLDDSFVDNHLHLYGMSASCLLVGSMVFVLKVMELTLLMDIS